MLSLKSYLQITGLIFAVVGLVHLIRLFQGWTVVINEWTVPMWVSIFGVLIPWCLAYHAFTLSGKKSKK